MSVNTIQQAIDRRLWNATIANEIMNNAHPSQPAPEMRIDQRPGSATFGPTVPVLTALWVTSREMDSPLEPLHRAGRTSVVPVDAMDPSGSLQNDLASNLVVAKKTHRLATSEEIDAEKQRQAAELARNKAADLTLANRNQPHQVFIPGSR